MEIIKYFLQIYDINLIYNTNTTTDENVFKAILQTGNYKVNLFNEFITIKYFFEYIDFYSDLNLYETQIMLYLQINQRLRILWIIRNITELFSSVLNEYTFTLLTTTYTKIPNIGVNVQGMELNLKINTEVIDYFLKIKTYKTNYSRLGILENILYNIKLTTIHRVNNINIINNGKKLKRINNLDLGSVKFTNGNVVVVPSSIVSIFGNFKLSKKIPNYMPKTLQFKSNNCITDLLNNNNYTYNLWIEKSKNKIDITALCFSELGQQPYDLSSIVNAVNALNTTQIKINTELYNLIIKNITTSDLYASIGGHKITTNQEIHTLHIDNMEISLDSTYSGELLTKKQINNFAEYTTLNSQILDILKYNNSCFYVTHQLDRRSRIYAAHWPLNYQLNHFVRNTVYIGNLNAMSEVYTSFFNSEIFLKYANIVKFWHVQYINTIKLEIYLISAGIDLNINQLKIIKTWQPETLNNQIILESIILTLINLAPPTIITLQEKLNYSIAAILNSTLHILPITELFDKKFLNQRRELFALENIKGQQKCMYWADASSNALQLITLAAGTDNNFLLKLLNIVDNDTGYKNIYYYITNQIKLATNTLNTFNKEMETLLTPEIIKTIAMPAAYGKTYWSCIKTISQKLLESSNHQLWTELTLQEQRELIKLWYDITHKTLIDLGLDIHNYIKLCKAGVDNIVKSHLNIPIITKPVNILNRSGIRKQLKNSKNTLTTLITNFIDNHKNELGIKITYAKALEIITTSVLDFKHNHAAPPPRDYLSILKLQSKLIKLNKILNDDENHTRRINVSIKPNYRYQFRVLRQGSHPQSKLKKKPPQHQT